MAFLKYMLSIAFVLAGGAKILKAKPMVEQFKEFGLPANMTILIGALEVLGAIGLQLSSLSLYTSVGLIILMLGAIANHVKVKHPISKMLPSIILSILLAIYIYIKLR